MADYDLDADDDFNYDEVDIEDDGNIAQSMTEDDDAQLDNLLRSVQATKERDAPPPVRADLTRLPVVVDDFIRNFLVKHNLLNTLEAFELEWYERFGTNPEDEPQLVPDVYLENAQLVDRTASLERDLTKHKAISQKAMNLWSKVKKERDLHRMNHGRLMQEKSKLSHDLKRLQTHSMSIEPTVTELRQKYENCQKDKMLLRLERDKLQARIGQLEENLREAEGQTKEKQTKSEKSAKSTAAPSAWPADNRPNPYVSTTTIKAPPNYSSWSSRAPFKAHSMAVSSIAVHPTKDKSVVASSSDDGTWRLFTLAGDPIMTGEGHKDWVSSISIHPKGTMAATASGDKTVKLWDFVTAKCKATMTGHTDGVWSTEFQETGELLVSGGMDHTARIWDVERAKCRQTLRGHIDSVNSASWLPYTNLVVTGSSDTTVSLWDARVNYCVQTYYGHKNSISRVACSLRGDTIASCDADGNVFLWDPRVIDSKNKFECGPHPANCVSFDKSGTLLAVASDDQTIRIINLGDEKITQLRGHEDAVQYCVFDPNTNGFLVSCGNDTTIRTWSS